MLPYPSGRAWDYVEDVFVHLMITTSRQQQPPSVMDGTAAGGGGGGAVGGGGGAGKDDPQQAKLAGLAAEYNALLASQLDEQLR